MTKKDKEEVKTSLYNFKIENNLTDMDYAGLKTQTQGEDKSLFTEKELQKALKAFNNRPAFIE